MSNQSPIEWTDATWNPVRGCTKISPGCKNCYAETFAERWRGIPGHPYEQGFDLRLVPEKLDEPLQWKKPRRIFVNSMSDLFQDGVPFEFVDQVFAVMALCPQHTFQVLTKRADRMQKYFSEVGYRQEMIGIEAEYFGGIDRFLHGEEVEPITGCGDDILPRWTLPLPNVCLGVSAETQKYFDERVDLLGQCPAAVRFVSIEPMLENIDTGNAFDDPPDDSSYGKIHWIIVGGESGPGARPFDIKWARSIVQQCKAADVPVFVKQMGSQSNLIDWTERKQMNRKGGDMSEWPEELRVREFPK